MKTKIMVALLFVLFWVPASVGTSNINKGADLILYKQMLVELDARQHVCDTLFKVDMDEDIPDMRRDFRDYWCQGRYTVILYGPPGTTVTLFGGYNFDTEFGYLVIKKLDHNKVWLLDLILHPHHEWKTVEASPKTGAHQLYYQTEPLFDEKIASVKWGKWWEGPEPGDQTPQPPKKTRSNLGSVTGYTASQYDPR